MQLVDAQVELPETLLSFSHDVLFTLYYIHGMLHFFFPITAVVKAFFNYVPFAYYLNNVSVLIRS